MAMISLIRDKYLIAGFRDTFSEAHPIVRNPENAMQDDQRGAFAVFSEMQFHAAKLINCLRMGNCHISYQIQVLGVGLLSSMLIMPE